MLFKRDILATGYSEFIFGDRKECYKMTVIADDMVNIVISSFDWTGIEGDDSVSTARIKIQLNRDPAEVYTAVIPECSLKGYHEINIDDLDFLLMQLLDEPLNIEDLFTEIKPYFAKSDEDETEEDLETLLFQRLRAAFANKLIKVVK